MRRLVIDGQQRLTTLQLLLASAASCAKDDGADRQARLLTKLIRNDPDITSRDERFKVWPTNANQSAFRSVMKDGGPEAGGPDDPNNTVHEGYAYFRKAIRERAHESGARATGVRRGARVASRAPAPSCF